jgi:hypothetical protein
MPEWRKPTSANAACACSLILVLALHWPLLSTFDEKGAPLRLLAAYDVVLACLGVLMRALSNAKTGALPFIHSCSRRGPVRGFLCYLHLVQTLHLHLCVRVESTYVRFASALLTTSPWWMDRRGGWTIVMRGKSTFGDAVDDRGSTSTSISSLFVSHVAHLHGLFFALNLSVALSHFREADTNSRVVALPHFRWYWWCLHATTSADVLLQPLVDRGHLPAALLPWLTAASVLPAAVFALPVLAEHVSLVGFSASLVLWCWRQHKAASNFAIALVFTEVYEVAGLLASRYNLVDV